MTLPFPLITVSIKLEIVITLTRKMSFRISIVVLLPTLSAFCNSSWVETPCRVGKGVGNSEVGVGVGGMVGWGVGTEEGTGVGCGVGTGVGTGVGVGVGSGEGTKIQVCVRGFEHIRFRER